MLDLVLVLWGTTELTPLVAGQVCILSNHVKALPFVHQHLLFDSRWLPLWLQWVSNNKKLNYFINITLVYVSVVGYVCSSIIWEMEGENQKFGLILATITLLRHESMSQSKDDIMNMEVICLQDQFTLFSYINHKYTNNHYYKNMCGACSSD